MDDKGENPLNRCLKEKENPMHRYRRLTALVVSAMLLLAATGDAMINPHFTPVHLVKQAALIVSVDLKQAQSKDRYTASIRDVLKGKTELKALRFDLSKAINTQNADALRDLAAAAKPALFFVGEFVEEKDGPGDAPPKSRGLLHMSGQWAEFDGGGVADVLAPFAAGSVLFRGLAGGKFAPGVACAVQLGTGQSGACVADFDGGGRFDVLCASADGLRLWQNEGDDKFTDTLNLSGEIAYISKPGGIDCLVGDINNDGRQDALIAYSAMSPQLFFNRGYRSFGHAHTLDLAERQLLPASEQGQQSACLGDFDGDGAQDMVLALSSGEIWVFCRENDDREARSVVAALPAGSPCKGPVTVNRYRITRNMIGMMTMKEEGWPLLAAIVPIAILGTWCFQRLAFVPPRAGETVLVKAYFPVSMVGELAHVVPQEGVCEVSRGDSGSSGQWIQEIKNDGPDPNGTAINGIATWRIQARARPEPYAREIRCKTATVQKELLVGQPVYSPDVEFYRNDQPIMSARIDMKPVQFLGFVPGIDWLLLPPWLVAYFLIAIPSVSLIKRVTGIY